MAFLRSGNLYPRLARGVEIPQVEADGSRSADGVQGYVEVVRMPTLKKAKRRPKAAFAVVGFIPATRGVEISRD